MCRKSKAIFLILFPAAVLLGICCFVSFSLIPHADTLNCESLDYTNHSTSAHTDYFEDDISNAEPVIKQNRSVIFTDFQLKATRSFTSPFYSEIWRPPKNA
jgi:hypothetical protein